MKTLHLVARILLGLMFAVLGTNGFVPFIPAPTSLPATAVSFFTALMSSHFAYFVFGVQVISGVLLLMNRYVVLALVMLGAVIANILVFHVTMWPEALIPMPIVALVLWFLTAWPIRGYFAPIFVQKVEVG